MHLVEYDPLTLQKAQFLEAYKATGLNIASAARMVGWNTRRVRDLRQEDDDFHLAIDEAREEVVGAIEAKAFERALNGDPVMGQFMLKHNKPEVYNPAIKVDVNEEKVLVLKDFSGNLLHEQHSSD